MESEAVQKAEERAVEMVKRDEERRVKREAMQRQLKPIRDHIFVRMIEQNESVKGGIIIPDVAKEKKQEGEVVAVGRGMIDDMGHLIEPEVMEGDHVLLPSYGGTEVTIDEVVYQVIQEKHILAIIGKAEEEEKKDNE